MAKTIRGEAIRLASNMIKDVLQAKGIKLSWVKASEINKAAKQYVAENPHILRKAKANIAKLAR